MEEYWRKFLYSRTESDAFAYIYNYYVNDLLSYGISLGFNEGICRDAVHDVFYKLCVDRNKLTHVKNVTSYLFKSFRNRLFNIHNRKSKISNIEDEDIPFTTEITILETIINKEESEKLKKIVSELLNELTPRQREAIYLRYMQEMDYEDIAELMKMNSNSARRLVHRGIKTLREKAGDSKDYLFILNFILLLKT